MSKSVDNAQPIRARQVWSLDRAYSQSELPQSAPSSGCVSRSGSRPQSRPSLSSVEFVASASSSVASVASASSSVASVAYASSSVASSLYVLRRVESAFQTTPKSALSRVLLQMRRAVRQSKLQRNTERFVPLASIIGCSSEFADAAEFKVASKRIALRSSTPVRRVPGATSSKRK